MPGVDCELTIFKSQTLFAFGDPLGPEVWVVLFAEMIVAAGALMLVEGYGDNEALPLDPRGLICDCWYACFSHLASYFAT